MMSHQHDYTSSVERTGRYTYVATASSGATVTMASKGTPGAFSPVELLLAALGGCAGFGVERFVTRRAGEPVRMQIDLTGDLMAPQSNKLRQITVRYAVDTADGPVPDDMLGNAIRLTHERTCTVSIAIDESANVDAFVDDSADPAFQHRVEES